MLFPHRARIASLAAVGVIAAAGLAACGSSSEEQKPSEGFDGVIKVGVIQDLRGGPLAERSEAGRYGILAGIAQVNKDGGIEVDGKKYELVAVEKDSRHDATAAATAATGLVTDEEIDFLFGPAVAETMRASAAVVGAAGKLQLAITSSASVVGDPGSAPFDHSFGLGVATSTLFPAWIKMAQSAADGADSAAFLFQDDGIGRSQDAALNGAVDDAGLDLTDRSFYPLSSTTFMGPLTSIKNNDPDLLFFGFSPDLDATLIKEAGQLGVSKLLVSPDDALIAPEGGVGIPFLSVGAGGIYGPTGADAAREELWADLKTLNGDKYEQPKVAYSYYTIAGYAGALLLDQAIENAGSVDDVDKVIEAMFESEVTVAGEDNFKFDRDSRQFQPTLRQSATLVEADGDLTRLLFSADGSEILNEEPFDRP